jgi:hypothetical protein
MHSNGRGIWFLLSLGGLPIGCFTDQMKGSTGTSATTSSGTTQGASSEGSGGETTTAGAETGVITSETGATGSTGPVAETGSSEESGTGTSTTGEPTTDEQCNAYAANIVKCLPRYAEFEAYYAMYCANQKVKGLMLDGDACLQALEAYTVCIGTADCAAFDPEGEGACKDAYMASLAACPNLYADETTTE